MSGQSLLDKVWNDHIVVPETSDHPAVLYIDLHLIHEVTTPQPFAGYNSPQTPRFTNFQNVSPCNTITYVMEAGGIESDGHPLLTL